MSYFASKTFLVGVDGSEASMTAVRVAAMLAGFQDIVHIIHLELPGNALGNLSVLMSSCEEELRKFKHLNPFKCKCEVRPLPEGWSISGKLTYEANHIYEADGAASILVMGSAGKGDQDRNKPRPTGQPPMGKVAHECLLKCKVPIILTKDAAGGMKASSVSVAKRVGRSASKKTGLVFGVCVDASAIAKSAFDLAVHFAMANEEKHGSDNDDIVVMHVPMTQSGITPHMRRPGNSAPSQEQYCTSYYEAECDKVEACQAVDRACFKILHKKSSESVVHTVLRGSDDHDVDLLLMGSVELADPKKKLFLGSVSKALSEQSTAHVCVVKNYAS